MRPNGHGIRYLKSRTYKDGRTYYFWNAPKLTHGLKEFRWRTLGMDRAAAFEQANRLNRKLAQYREKRFGKPLRLTKIKPKTTAWLARAFEQSPKFRRYAKCTQEEYSRLYRKTEVFRVSGSKTYFGNLPFKKVTNQIAYGLYEHYTDGTKKLRTAAQMVEAWAAAFNYANCNISGSVRNPFRQIEKHPLRPRIQRWSGDQLDSFVRTAHSMGEHSIAMCALMCMELMQRPGDILSLKWESLLHRDGFIRIVQSKRGAEVIIPPTQRLKDALTEAFNRTNAKSLEEIRDRYICPTKTGKRWQKRNLTGDARGIARLAGLPEDLQLRDLRRTAATEAASAGATPWELMAVGGWQNPNSMRPYLVKTPEQAASIQAKREAFRTNGKAHYGADFCTITGIHERL